MTEESERLSIMDAAERLGVSVDTIRRKIRRGQMKATRDNQGRWWVMLPANAYAVKSPSAAYEPMQPTAYAPTQATDALTAALQDQVVFLRDQVERAQARISDLEGQLTAAGTAAATERARLLDVIEAERKRRRWWHK